MGRETGKAKHNLLSLGIKWVAGAGLLLHLIFVFFFLAGVQLWTIAKKRNPLQILLHILGGREYTAGS
jgi:hypothetical protein